MKLQSEFSRKFKKNNFRPFAAASKCGPVRPTRRRYASGTNVRYASDRSLAAEQQFNDKRAANCVHRRHDDVGELGVS